jgi:hypothetical protein
VLPRRPAAPAGAERLTQPFAGGGATYPRQREGVAGHLGLAGSLGPVSALTRGS